MNAEFYRQKAYSCRDRAARSAPFERFKWLLLAAEWERLAGQVESRSVPVLNDGPPPLAPTYLWELR